MARDSDPNVTRRQAENVRASIKASMIKNRLEDCVEGKIELTPAQVRAASVLLAKVVPDQKEVFQHSDTKNLSLIDIEVELKRFCNSSIKLDVKPLSK